MRSIFLSYHFGPNEPELVRLAKDVISAQNLNVETGEDLGGGVLLPEVEQRIRDSDAFVTLLTVRALLPANAAGVVEGVTHQWLLDELNFARRPDVKKRAIALLDHRVPLTGAYANHQYISFDPDALLAPLVRLSKTIGDWKRRAGKLIRIRIESPDVVGAFGNQPRTGRYRILNTDGTALEWRETSFIATAGAVFAYLKDAQDDWVVQLELEIGNDRWRSEFNTPYVSAAMRPDPKGAAAI